MSFFESLWGSSDSRDAERFSPTINTSQADATAVGSGPEAGSSGSGEPTDPDVGPEIDPGN